MNTLRSELLKCSVKSTPRKVSKYKRKCLLHEEKCRMVWEQQIKSHEKAYDMPKIIYALLKTGLTQLGRHDNYYLGRFIFVRQLKWYAEKHGIKNLEV